MKYSLPDFEIIDKKLESVSVANLFQIGLDDKEKERSVIYQKLPLIYIVTEATNEDSLVYCNKFLNSCYMHFAKSWNRRFFIIAADNTLKIDNQLQKLATIVGSLEDVLSNCEEKQPDFVVYFSPFLEFVAETSGDSIVNTSFVPDSNESHAYTFLKHPWYYSGIGDPERNVKCSAYISPKETLFHYVAPWIYGSTLDGMISLFETIRKWENIDSVSAHFPANGFESYLNKFAYLNQHCSVFLDESFGWTKQCEEWIENDPSLIWTGPIPLFIKDVKIRNAQSHKTNSVENLLKKIKNNKAALSKRLLPKERDVVSDFVPKSTNAEELSKLDEELLNIEHISIEDLFKRW